MRSLRTLELRVRQQSANAQKLVDWLAGELRRRRARARAASSRRWCTRSSTRRLQPAAEEEGSWLRRQMPDGYGAVFALLLKSEDDARTLPSKLHLFHHATSLGGVEA